MVLPVEVNFSGFPVFADFAEQRRDEAQACGRVGKAPGDAGAAFAFLVHPFARVGRAHSLLMFDGQGEDAEALGQIVLPPRRELGCGLGLRRDEGFELAFGGGAVRAVKAAAARGAWLR